MHAGNERGMTLMEIMIAAMLGVVIAGGMMLAFNTAQKTSGAAVGTVEASDFAQQTLERFRNKIACDDPNWFNQPNCAVNASGLPTVWTNDAMTGTGGPEAFSVLGQSGARQYRVTQLDCDGDGTVGDCFQVDSRVQWTPKQ